MKSIKKLFIGIVIFIAAFCLFAIVFPIVHNPETFDPKAAAPDGSFITLGNGVRIHYYEAGRGETVVLIHGFCSNAYTWKENIPELSKKYHVLALDLAGFGFSDKPAGADYGYRLFADTVKRFIDAKKAGRVSLIGNSMGGGVSLRFTLDNPGRVGRLVLVDSAGLRGKAPLGLRLLGVPGWNNFLASINNEYFMSAILRQSMFYDGSRVTPDRVKNYLLPFRTRGAMAAASKTINAIHSDFGDTDFKNIKTPTLIVWGDKDKILSPAFANVFHRLIHGSELVMIPKCGHLPQEEKPAEFNRIVMDFLK
jgi:pimeloyl-ACP methyl ester carboxylesterase